MRGGEGKGDEGKEERKNFRQKKMQIAVLFVIIKNQKQSIETRGVIKLILVQLQCVHDYTAIQKCLRSNTTGKCKRQYYHYSTIKIMWVVCCFFLTYREKD